MRFISAILIFVSLLLIAVFMARLGSPKTTISPMIGKPLTEFSLPAINSESDGLTSADLRGKYAILNIFAQWCITCKYEHPVLMQIKEKNGLPIYGVAWRDNLTKLNTWLKNDGNPYEKIGADNDGSLIIKLGVTGAPESFLISPEGIVLFNYKGALTQKVYEEEILPLVKK